MGISRRGAGRLQGRCRLLAAIVATVGALVGQPGHLQAHDDDDRGSQFTVGQYVEVSRRAITQKDVEYTFLASVTNHGAAARDVVCVARADDRDDDDERRDAISPSTIRERDDHDQDDDAGLILLDNTLGFGTVGAGARVRSLDTFSFRQRRTVSVDLRRLTWKCTSGGNRRPIANAGPDQTALPGSRVTLDGSASSDADGDRLSFQWTLLSRPAGSAAVLAGPTTVHPTFVADQPGQYEAQLVVGDGTLESVPDRVVVSSVNSAPVARAGPDQTVRKGSVVTLDGSGSSDVDGDRLTYSWAMVTLPTGSAAALSDVHAVRPTFVADVLGDYVVRLVVSDGRADSAADMVVVSTKNSTPTADAGPDQTAPVSATVHLDGSGSTDLDGDSLRFRWSLLSVPAGSTAVLSDPSAVRPAFTIDRKGTYVAQLIVNDGRADSAPDTVQVDTTNPRPVAEAGGDQTVAVGSLVTLDGSASHDADGDALTLRWTLVSLPPGSHAVLTDPASMGPAFTTDLAGHYVVSLVVNDGVLDSAADTVAIDTLNSRPHADAGPDGTAVAGATVSLDGSASRDPDGDALTFRWSFTSRPEGSAAELSDPAAAQPTFAALLPGTYVAQLIVNDGTMDSEADTTVVIVTSSNQRPHADAGPDQVQATGATVHLDGSASSDPDGATPLVFSWALVARPDGSAAALSGPDSPAPTFVADRAGDYVARLVVRDGGGLDSDPATVTIHVQDGADVALDFFNPLSSPVIGSGSLLLLEVRNSGPRTPSDLAVHFLVPAGYTVLNGGPDVGSYDPGTGLWTIGSLVPGITARLTLGTTVNMTGPYDLTASVAANR